MTKKHLWLRLLSLLLVCGMLLGCFAGCSKSESDAKGDADEDEAEAAEEVRDELVRYKTEGLKIYLSEEFEELSDGMYATEDESMYAIVSGFWLEDDLIEASSAKELRALWIDEFEEEEDKVEKGKENGTPYVYVESDGETGVIGFYYKDGYGWLVTIAFEEASQKDEAIKYATLCEISKVPEKVDDEDEGDLAPDVDIDFDDDYVEDDYIEDDYVEDEPQIDVPLEPEREEVTLTIWTPAFDQDSGWLANRLDAFEAAYPEYEITWEVGVCSEGDIGNVVGADPEIAADVYFFANDQIGRLAEAGALAKLGGSYADQVYNDNTDIYVDTVTYTDGEVYGFPMTCNTWFMYYNKDVYTAEDIKTMDALLSKGVVSMQLANGWYNVSFFAGNGGTLFGNSGRDAAAGIQFGGQVGYGAAEAMINLASHQNFVNDADGAGVAGMCAGTVDAMFSGSWDYQCMYQYLGDKLGCAPLPTITISGKQVQMKAFAGSKAVGVNPYCENQKLAMDLAAFLASEESQLKRFEASSITPAHVNLSTNATVLSSQVAATEMAVMNNCAIVQPVIYQMSGFWSPMGTFGSYVLVGNVNLTNYKAQVDQLYEQLNSGL